MKYVTVHGHFYQPPRENPWLESIEPQDSAAPYHDWNERILAECYAPNARSRILDERDAIIDIVNNYARISFDFGPTLLSWLEEKAEDVYRAVLEADEESRARFSGHGSALAQVYNHVIMPLAAREDKEIQVVWGIREFVHRFRRRPEGMWLAETAVDLETLEVLAAHDIRFTLLAPSQASRVRARGQSQWRDVSSGGIDGTVPYLQKLPSGREIAIFFYDGPTSRAVAFEGLLHRGESFAKRLVGILGERVDRPRLAHIATDGETYGHHHSHGDMALAFALHAIETQELARLTNYGEFLEKFPPVDEVEILERTSWSCAHGVERWRSDCGCRTGGPPGWNQSFRTPLRESFDRLRTRIAPAWRRRTEEIFHEPRRAVLDYIDVVLDRSSENVVGFLGRHARRELAGNDRVVALKLLEIARQLQLMYTSCGWFFNDVSGIETVQVLRYAGRAVQLAEDVLSESIERELLEDLAKAKSNRPDVGTAADLYRRNVKPGQITFESLTAHYCISSLFEPYPDETSLYCYEVERTSYGSRQAGKTRLLFGKARLTSRITLATATLDFAALHLGDHALTAGVARHLDDERHRALVAEIEEPFQRGDTALTLRLIDKTFQPHVYDLRSLFGDEQRRIVARLVRSTLDQAEAVHRQIYENHGATMRFLADLGVPLPRVLSVAAEVVLNGNLRRALSSPDTDEREVSGLIREAAAEGVTLDDTMLSFHARLTLEELAERFFERPEDLPALETLRRKVRLAQSLPFEVELWKLQNLTFQATRTLLAPERRHEASPEWLDEFLALARDLSIRIPEEPSP